jgi:hypothetical protein
MVEIPIFGVQSKVESFAAGEQRKNLIKDLCTLFCLGNIFIVY